MRTQAFLRYNYWRRFAYYLNRFIRSVKGFLKEGSEMKTVVTKLTGGKRTYASGACFAVILVAAFCVFSTAAYATVVQTTTKKMSAGQADFGSGNHSAGSPEGSASIIFDWNDSSGQLVSTGHVKGTIYWDSLFDSGCVLLQI